MANTRKIDPDVLRVLDLGRAPGVSAREHDADCARKIGCSDRGIRHARKALIALYPKWPNCPLQTKPQPAHEPRPEIPLMPPSPATPDQLEAWLESVLMIAAVTPGLVDVPAAKALIELAERRRSRRPDPLGDVDPEQARADVMREIERATENV